ncbi:hypothetical protein Cni_G13652 [Canna indica]|uniref:Uncharacterized protein n=1 Tax=Canna indica TaxID=4628 RepID=A0AAQ3KAA1_9LILI|nr:hypothetical protein Cni_G13652 [Canna indica]
MEEAIFLRLRNQPRTPLPSPSPSSTSLIWLPIGFPNPTSHFVSHHLLVLKSSLSRTLRHFYPLAGRVTPLCGPSTDTRFEIRYSAGDSVPLTLAESADDFEQLSGDQPRGFGSVYSLILPLPPIDDGSIPLLVLQITVFLNQGVALDVAGHHVACDDSNSIHFVKSWVVACIVGDSSESLLSPLPLLCDPTAIADPDGLYHKITLVALVPR